MVDQSDGRDRGWNNEHAPSAESAREFGANSATGNEPHYQTHQPDTADPAGTSAEDRPSVLQDEQVAAPAGEHRDPTPAETVSESPSIVDSVTDDDSTLRADEYAPQTSAAAEPSLSTSRTQEFVEPEPWPQPASLEISLGRSSEQNEAAPQQSVAGPVASAADSETAMQATAEEPEPMVEVETRDSAGEFSAPTPDREAIAPRPTSGSFAGFDADAYGLPMASLDSDRAAAPSSEEGVERPNSDAADPQRPPAASDPTEGAGFVMRDADPEESTAEETTLAPQAAQHEFIPTADPAPQNTDGEQAEATPEESQGLTSGSSAEAPTAPGNDSDYSDSSLPVWEAVAAEMAAAVAADPGVTDAAEPTSFEAPTAIETTPGEESPASHTDVASGSPSSDAESSVAASAESVGRSEGVGDEPASETPEAGVAGDPAGEAAAESSPPSADESTSDESIDVNSPAPVDASPVEADAPEIQTEDATSAEAEEGRADPDESGDSPEPVAEARATDAEDGDEIEAAGSAAEDEAPVTANPEDTFSYLVSDARFEVIDGELRLKDGISLDAGREPTIDVLVATIDAEGDSLAENYTVTIDESGGRPAPIPLNDPSSEQDEPPLEAEVPPSEEAASSESETADLVDEVPTESGLSSQAFDIPEVSRFPESQELGARTNDQDPKPAATEPEEEPAAEAPKEAVSVRSIEETFLTDNTVDAPDAGHDFLMLGSNEEAGDEGPAKAAAGESDEPQPEEAGSPEGDAEGNVETGDGLTELATETTASESSFGEGDDAPTEKAAQPDGSDGEEAPDDATREIVGVSNSDAAKDDAEWEAFLFEPEGAEQDSGGPAAEDDAGDALDLSEVAESGRSWTIILNDGSEIKGTGEDYLDLSEDASGTITFDDGTEMTFDSVERVTW